MTSPSQSHKQTIEDFEGTKNAWFKAFKFWQAIHYALGLTITSGSLAVAANPPCLRGLIQTENLAFIVAAVSAVFTLLGSADRSKRYRQAWLALDQAIIPYKSGSIADLEDVRLVNEQGEAVLAGIPLAAPIVKS